MGNKSLTGLTALKVGESVYSNLDPQLTLAKLPIAPSCGLEVEDKIPRFVLNTAKSSIDKIVGNQRSYDEIETDNKIQEIMHLETPNYIFNHSLTPYPGKYKYVKNNKDLQCRNPKSYLNEQTHNPQEVVKLKAFKTDKSICRKPPTAFKSGGTKLRPSKLKQTETIFHRKNIKEKVQEMNMNLIPKFQDLEVECKEATRLNMAYQYNCSIPLSQPFKSLIMAAGMSKTTCQLVENIKEWKFDKSKLQELPLDEEKNNYLRRNNRGCLFSHVMPTQLKSPTLVAFSKDALINILNMDPNITKTQEFADFIAGNRILENSFPLAHRYGGHQFGYWAMQLGDGRAILLGEFINSAGERWELQLKGSGRTPYSRDGDGRAVLRSSIREFLCSEAMYYLGIPTSRAGAIVVSEETAFRDPMYDGNPVMEKTAVVLRLAPTWFRFGSFELPMKTNELDLLKKLFDFILKEHFPDIDPSADDRVLTFLSRVACLTSDLVVAWQAVGFTHGVLNTDNMSVLGITIDYGPFGFVEAYDPEYIPNASDHEGRYCYIRQPSIIMYNLMKLTEALLPLMSETQKTQASGLLQAESDYITDSLIKTFSTKLGLPESDKMLVGMFTTMLEETKADFTMSFRDLSEIELDQLDRPCPSSYWALATLAQHGMYTRFVSLYREKLKAAGITDIERRKQMCQKNPRYVLRNWMAQMAIKEAEEDNFTEVERLLRILSSPFTRQEEAEKMGFAKPPPGWASKLNLSCSS